jgi:sugar porter (SP) family MFS transporter
MSGAIGPIQKDFDLSDVQEGIVVGCINIVAAPGALLGGRVADRLGRVTSVAGTAIVLIIGPLLVATSTGFLQLFLGRVITGVGVGLSFVLAPLYAAEVAPSGIRAGIVTVTEILINAGVMLGYVSAVFLDMPGVQPGFAWRVVTGVASVPALLTLLAFPLLPESPRWLVQVQRRDEAIAVLRRLSPSDESMQESLKSIDEALANMSKEAGWSAVLFPSVVVRRMLCAGLGVAFFQQVSGSEAIVYYTPTILENFGLESDSDKNMGAMAVGSAKFLGACLGACFLDCVGRRVGVMVSCLGVATCLVSLAALPGVAIPAIGVSLLCLFMVFFELGLAPAAFVLGTECYPVEIRAKALGLGMFITRFLSGLVAVAFPTIAHDFSTASCLWAFSVCACIGIPWAFICVPETMGLSLEEVTLLFEKPIAESLGVYTTSQKPEPTQVDSEQIPLQA